MYKLLSFCSWEMGHKERAIREGQKALNIMLKHTPTDYAGINLK
jgi:hypothetical protein